MGRSCFCLRHRGPLPPVCHSMGTELDPKAAKKEQKRRLRDISRVYDHYIVSITAIVVILVFAEVWRAWRNAGARITGRARMDGPETVLGCGGDLDDVSTPLFLAPTSVHGCLPGFRFFRCADHSPPPLALIPASSRISFLVKMKRLRDSYAFYVGEAQKLGSHFVRTALPIFERLLAFDPVFLKKNLHEVSLEGLEEREVIGGDGGDGTDGSGAAAAASNAAMYPVRRAIVLKTAAIHALFAALDVVLFPPTVYAHTDGVKAIAVSNLQGDIVATGGESDVRGRERVWCSLVSSMACHKYLLLLLLLLERAIVVVGCKLVRRRHLATCERRLTYPLLLLLSPPPNKKKQQPRLRRCGSNSRLVNPGTDGQVLRPPIDRDRRSLYRRRPAAGDGLLRPHPPNMGPGGGRMPPGVGRSQGQVRFLY